MSVLFGSNGRPLGLAHAPLRTEWLAVAAGMPVAHASAAGNPHGRRVGMSEIGNVRDRPESLLLPNSEFRIHAQRTFYNSVNELDRAAWRRRYKIRTRTGPLFCKLLIAKVGSTAWIRTTGGT
jgi:hypothetical protein